MADSTARSRLDRRRHAGPGGARQRGGGACWWLRRGDVRGGGAAVARLVVERGAPGAAVGVAGADLASRGPPQPPAWAPSASGPSTRLPARTSCDWPPRWSTPTRLSTSRSSWPTRARSCPSAVGGGGLPGSRHAHRFRRLHRREQPRASHRGLGPFLVAPVGGHLHAQVVLRGDDGRRGAASHAAPGAGRGQRRASPSTVSRRSCGPKVTSR